MSPLAMNPTPQFADRRPPGRLDPLYAECLPVESLNVAVSRRVPLLVDPSLRPAFAKFVAELARNPDRGRKQRLTTYRDSMEPALLAGFLVAAGATRQRDGRIRLYGPSIQNIANVLRRYFRPPPGFILLDLDYANAHMHIAARRSGDKTLIADLARFADYYETVAKILLPDFSTLLTRKPIKYALLALLNGGTVNTIMDRLGEIPGLPRAQAAAEAKRLFAWFWRRYARLAAYCDINEAFAASRKNIVPVHSLAGRVRDIDVTEKADRGWTTLLAALWTGCEADAMNNILQRLHAALLPFDGALVLPLYDGLLVMVREGCEEDAADALRLLMTFAMERAGVPDVGVKIESQTRWSVTERTL